MISAYLYTGHSLGPVGGIALAVAVVVRIAWIVAQRRSRR
jgi:hypothetical protein